MSGRQHNSKRWHFEIDDTGDDSLKGVKVIRDSSEILNRKGTPVGHVVDLRTPSTRKLCKQAESYLSYAVEIQFEDKTAVVLNRENFEWNHSAATEFNQCFREKISAADFIHEFKRVTTVDPHTMFRILKKDVFQDTSDDSEEMLSDDPNLDEYQEDSQPAKRSRTDDDSCNVNAPPSKVSKSTHGNPLDDNILDKRIGIFDLPITSLCETSSSRLIRSLDKQFLKNLKEKMACDPSSPGVPPIAALCKDIQQPAEFSKRLMNVYKYEVLGGQHTSHARAQLHQEQPNNALFATILAEVYVGLSDDEALRLASRHNINGHFIHKMTHRDYVEACRSKLFLMNGLELSDETPPPTAEWKKMCGQCINIEVLNAVLSNEKSLKELKEAAAKFRSMQTIRKTFCKVTNTSWEEATERFPHYAKEDRLIQFSSLSFTKDVPQPFMAYCRAALHSENSNQPCDDLDSYDVQGCIAYTLQHNILTLSHTDITEKKIPFNGAHLFLTHIPENMAAEDMRKLVYTSRQLNALPDNPLTTFNCIALCSISQMDMVVTEMKRCYDNVERGYWSWSSSPTSSIGSSPGLFSAVNGIVIGHFSVDGKLKQNHYNFRQVIPNLFQVEGKSSGSTNPPSHLYQTLVERFSFTGQTILDTMTEGQGASAALRVGRNAISVDSDISTVKFALQRAVSSAVQVEEGTNSAREDENELHSDDNEN